LFQFGDRPEAVFIVLNFEFGAGDDFAPAISDLNFSDPSFVVVALEETNGYMSIGTDSNQFPPVTYSD